MSAFLRVLGADPVTSHWCALRCGAGGDVGSVAVIGGIAAWLRKHNCHVHGCHRLARHLVEGTQHLVCARHHPTGAPRAAEIKEGS